MEMFISILLSLNKISLVGFFLTLIFVFYQIRLLMREIKQRKTKLTIPDFKETNVKLKLTSSQLIIPEDKKNKYQKSIFNNIIAGLILLIIFGMIVFFNLANRQTKENVNSITPTPVINLTTTPAIKIYDENWREISNQELINLKPGTKIIVGVETINGLDIDIARIRINNNNWGKETMTTMFNQSKKVFYREYQISSQEAYLKIEAQLHSASEGWLGD